MEALDLDALKPESADVYVGDSIVFKMREPSIAQTREVLRVAATVDLKLVIEPLIKLMRGDDGTIGTTTDAAALLGRIQTIGPELFEAARPVLGEQFAPAVMSGAIACLDTRRFRAVVIKANIFKEDDLDIEHDEDGSYMGCPCIRAWLREELTTRQAVYILSKAVDMIDVVGSVGNLFGALMPESSPETASE